MSSITYTNQVDDDYLVKLLTKLLSDNSILANVIMHSKELNVIITNKDDIVKALTIFKNDDSSLKMLIDVSAIDYLFARDGVGIYSTNNKYSSSALTDDKSTIGNEHKRFDIIYSLLSFKLNKRIRVRVALDDQEQICSVSSVFSSACWFEREVFDMFGINFINSPDNRRILTDYNFEGFPLRKDFPLTGFKQIRYDNSVGKIIEEPVSLNQEYRVFDFEMPWKGAVYNIKNNS